MQRLAELNNICVRTGLWRGKRTLSCLHVWFSVLLLQNVVSPCRFSFTTSENTEIPSTTTKCVAFNCQSPFFRKFRWILNLVRLSRRNWPYTYDEAFCYSALLQRISSFFYRLGNVSSSVLWKTFIFDDRLVDTRWYQATSAWSLRFNSFRWFCRPGFWLIRSCLKNIHTWSCLRYGQKCTLITCPLVAMERSRRT